MDISDIYTILLRLAFYCDQNAAKKWISVLLKFYRSLIGNEPASDNTEVCEHRPSTTDHLRRREEIAKNINWEKFVQFFMLLLCTKTINCILNSSCFQTTTFLHYLSSFSTCRRPEPNSCRIYLFVVLRHFQHCTGHITTGSWEGRGNQYIQLVKVLHCKLLTNGK